ncbi:MAG: hypothetical protein V4504_01160 [Patescibacteria group bacterium]
MKTNKMIILTDLFSDSEVDSYLHGYCRGSINSFFKSSPGDNMVWNLDPSIKLLLNSEIPISSSHDCCAVDLNRPATVEEIISNLGGKEKIIKHHLWSYQNIGQLAGHAPSYRRCFGDTLKVKEEMNLFFVMGKDEALCVVGLYFGPFPKGQYSLFALKVSEEEKKKLNFSSKFFSFFKRTQQNNSVPQGTRVFLIGEPSEVLFNEYQLEGFNMIS